MARKLKTIMVIDDDRDTCWLLSQVLGSQGFCIKTVFDGRSAIAELVNVSPELVLLDLNLPEIDGMGVLEEIRKSNKDVIVIILSGYGDTKRVVNAMKLGAFDYITKPFNNKELAALIKNAMESRLKDDTEGARQNISLSSPESVKGISPQIRHVFELIEAVAPTNMTVVLQGESGTGKELMARLIHSKSSRKNGPFVALDCGTLQETLVESELFGYEKGAFTGAAERKEGHFELANKGTLFLDEVANIKESVQLKLLRVLQERRVRHLGGKKDIPVDVRIITATNTTMSELVKLGKFRGDLYYRLNEFLLELPPLRCRSGDIPVLAEHFIEEANLELGKKVKGLTEKVTRLFLNYAWPGNVRELKNIIRRAVLMTESEYMDIGDMPGELQGARDETGTDVSNGDVSLRGVLKESIKDLEREAIEKALALAKNNKSKAAKILQIDRTTLYSKLKSLGILDL
ncbi:MAG TPA: sigma-54 dependent transcriptional regulator [Syntrophales bacterium]|nr:sigma-54 dependent transcriptional regulator [Syntrophales bacterium]